jgi:hypothetical protein
MGMQQLGSGMPTDNERVREYCLKAEQARRWAASAPNAKLRQAWLQVADQYETLSIELERINRF